MSWLQGDNNLKKYETTKEQQENNIALGWPKTKPSLMANPSLLLYYFVTLDPLSLLLSFFSLVLLFT